MSPHFFTRRIEENDYDFGQRLQKRRETSFISRKTAALELKVLEKYIVAIEENDKTLLPLNIYSINLLKRYAVLLKEDPEMIVALFRKTHTLTETVAAPNFEIKRKDLRIRSRVLQHLFFLGIGALVIGYLAYKAVIITSPPKVVIFEPEENWVMATPMLMVRGKTDPAAKVKINGQSVPPNAQGIFSQEVVLGVGANVIEVSATKRYSRERLVTRTVTLSGRNHVSFK